MYERIRRLYEAGRLEMNGLINAKKKRLIDDEQFFAICGRFFDDVTGNKAGEGDNAPKEVSGNG